MQNSPENDKYIRVAVIAGLAEISVLYPTNLPHQLFNTKCFSRRVCETFSYMQINTTNLFCNFNLIFQQIMQNSPEKDKYIRVAVIAGLPAISVLYSTSFIHFINIFPEINIISRK